MANFVALVQVGVGAGLPMCFPPTLARIGVLVETQEDADCASTRREIALIYTHKG
jgi:hypothetical protein